MTWICPDCKRMREDHTDDGHCLFKDAEVTSFVCGTPCVDGKAHDGYGLPVKLRDDSGRIYGESTSCSRCGSLAMDRSILEG